MALLKDKWLNENRHNERECIIEMFDFGRLMFDDSQLTVEDYRDIHRMMSSIRWELGKSLQPRIDRGEYRGMPSILLLERNDQGLRARMEPLFRKDDAKLRADLAEFANRDVDYFDKRRARISKLIDEMYKREADAKKG